MSICTTCGAQLSGEDRFCPSCGTPVPVPQGAVGTRRVATLSVRDVIKGVPTAPVRPSGTWSRGDRDDGGKDSGQLCGGDTEVLPCRHDLRLHVFARMAGRPQREPCPQGM